MAGCNALRRVDTIKQERRREQQIALVQAEAGASVAETYRGVGVAEQTLCRWKKRWGDLGVWEICRPEQLGDVSRRPKRLVADPMPGSAMLQDALEREAAHRPHA